MNAAAAPDRYAVFGHPVAHSLSPRIHAAFAAQTGEWLSYQAIEAPLDGFAAAVEHFFAGGGRGANVTLPFKAEAFALAARHDAHAALARVANTLRREPDGSVSAYNTDGVGLARDLDTNLRCALTGRRLLLLGAGGAAAGVLGPLLAGAPGELVITNRTPARAAGLAQRHADLGPVVAAPLAALAGRFDLVINATAAGHAGERLTLPPGLFAPAALAYDLSYGAAAQPFLAWARVAGAARTSDGLGMLVEQAAEAFHIWRGVRPATGAVLAALRAEAAGGA